MQTNDSGRSVLSGLFHDSARAESALTELKNAGYAHAEISEVDTDADADAGTSDATSYAGNGTDLDRDERATGRSYASTATTAAASGGSFFREHEARASSFGDELAALGFSKHDAQHLVDAVVRGQALVTVDAASLGVAGAQQILERYDGKVYFAEGVGPGALGAAATAAAVAPQPVAAAAAVDTTGAREIELREERLQLDKRRVQHGEARLSKRVVTETQTIDVPVTHEELVIERTPVTSGTPAGTIADGEEIVIPLSTEVVNVEKRVVATENVTVGKRQVEGVEHVGETLRREELVVDDAARPDVRERSL